MTNHQPKGGMCYTCRKKFDQCSGLPFGTMRVIEHCKDGTIKMVKCDKYVKQDDEK